MYRTVGTVEVETIDGRIFEQPRSDEVAWGRFDDEVDGCTVPRTDSLVAPQLVGRVLVQVRADPGWSTFRLGPLSHFTLQVPAREAVRQKGRAEPLAHGIEDRARERFKGPPCGVLRRDVAESLSAVPGAVEFSKMRERVPALDEVPEPEGAPAGSIEVDGHAVAMADWAAFVNKVGHGKRLPEAIYLHRSALDKDVAQVAAAAAEIAGNPPHEVVKLALREPVVSLLHYPGFDADAFPALESSVRVDLRDRAAQARTYAPETAPVLHRKELLLRPGDGRFREWSALTRQAEDAGLFAHATAIGSRSAWQAVLATAGLRVEGHTLVPDRAEVYRHRTALVRYALSTPMQALLQHGFLQGRSVFDYGCGRGGDVAQLQRMEVAVRGWDPHFAPDNEKSSSDVVNLGFVLNVIEDPRERAEALRGAWALTRVLLSVAVLIKGRSAWEKHRLFGDGVLTSRGTFQKYFLQDELRAYIEQHTGRQPIALAPGLFFVFRSDEDEQAFLAERQRGRALPAVPRPPPLPRPERTSPPRRGRGRPARTPKLDKWQQHEDVLVSFWTTCLRLGRMPEPSEFAGDLSPLGSAASVFRRCLKQFGEADWTRAVAKRQDDLLVWLALGCFEQRRSYSALPAELRVDVRTFWRRWSDAQEAGRHLLFSAGERSALLDAAEAAVIAGIACRDDGSTVSVLGYRVVELPPVLRVFIGCAGQIYGAADAADVIKLHLTSSRLTLLNCDDFDSPLPSVIERVRVDLRRLTIHFHSYESETVSPEVVLFKSRLLAAHDPRLTAASRFDELMSDVGVTPADRLTHREVLSRLQEHGCELVDAEWVRPGDSLPRGEE